MSDPATYHIRSATVMDFDIIYGFVNALEETVFERDILYNIFQKNIASGLNIYLIAADQDHAPAGYISCHGQYLLHHAGLVGEIQELFVRPDKRGEGIGRLLVEAVKDRALHMGMVQSGGNCQCETPGNAPLLRATGLCPYPQEIRLSDWQVNLAGFRLWHIPKFVTSVWKTL